MGILRMLLKKQVCVGGGLGNRAAHEHISLPHSGCVKHWWKGRSPAQRLILGASAVNRARWKQLPKAVVTVPMPCLPVTQLSTRVWHTEGTLCGTTAAAALQKAMGPRQELPVPTLETAIIQDLRNWFLEQHISILKNDKRSAPHPGSNMANRCQIASIWALGNTNLKHIPLYVLGWWRRLDQLF